MMTTIRRTMAYGSGITALLWGGLGVLIAQPKAYEYDAVQTEQRITSVEVRLDMALQQLRDIKDTQGKVEYAGYLQLLMLGGLGIEAGNRLRKRKQGGGE